MYLCVHFNLQLIFTDPYYHSSFNKHTTPQLDDVADEFTKKDDLKAQVAVLKHKFEAAQEALIHGDLHTGSVMVTQETTYVMDHEFAFYGPMGFDIGAFVGNLLIAYLASYGQEKQRNESREEQRAWLDDTIASVWNNFRSWFISLWNTAVENDASGASRKDVYGNSIGKKPLNALQSKVLAQIWQDTLGYAGCKMIRRVLGVAHVADLESIENKDVRAQCERKVLALAEALVLHGHRDGMIQNSNDLSERLKQQ